MYYLNFSFLLSLYEVIPLEIIIMTFDLVLFNSYFKDEKIIILMFVSLFYIIFYSTIKIICFSIQEITPFLLIASKIKNY